MIFSELSYSLRSSLAGGGEFAVTLGRFHLTDPTGSIYDDQLDGASVKMSSAALALRFSGGYTGLLFDHDNTILLSRADASARFDEDPLGPPRVLIEVASDLRVPSIGMTLRASILGQFDFHDPGPLALPGDTTLASGGAVNTQYQTLGVSGSFAGVFDYAVSGTVNTGTTLYYDGSQYVSAPIRALLADGLFRYAPDVALDPRIELNALFATGDDDAVSLIEGNTGGAATSFVPVSNRSLAVVADPFLANLFRGQLSLAVAPPASSADALRVAVHGTTFLQPSSGASPFPGVGSGHSGYVGTEVALVLESSPVRFFNVLVESGIYFPSAAAYGSSEPQYTLSGTASLSF